MASSELIGILNINKPTGWTSHDVVAKVRRLAGQKRVGHAGTLDPLAEGVLPVLLGRATRLSDFIQLGRKTYVAEVTLGTATDTDDTAGSVIAQAPVPDLSPSQIALSLAQFAGEILQTPPKYSALKVAGQRAYALARAGADPDLAPRAITIDSLRLLSCSETCLRIEVTCSKGTYIRALARDIATALGTVGHMSSLVRTGVGPFSLDASVALDALADHGVATSLLSASCAIPSAPSVSVSGEQAQRITNGQAIAWAALRAEHVWVYDPEGHLLCLGSVDGESLRPRLLL